MTVLTWAPAFLHAALDSTRTTYIDPVWDMSQQSWDVFLETQPVTKAPAVARIGRNITYIGPQMDQDSDFHDFPAICQQNPHAYHVNKILHNCFARKRAPAAARCVSWITLTRMNMSWAMQTGLETTVWIYF